MTSTKNQTMHPHHSLHCPHASHCTLLHQTSATRPETQGMGPGGDDSAVRPQLDRAALESTPAISRGGPAAVVAGGARVVFLGASRRPRYAISDPTQCELDPPLSPRSGSHLWAHPGTGGATNRTLWPWRRRSGLGLSLAGPSARG